MSAPEGGDDKPSSLSRVDAATDGDEKLAVTDEKLAVTDEKPAASADVPRSSEDLRSLAHARIGTVLNDKWTLERLLGTGGMGAVYEGRHRNGARAAVKVLHPLYAREPAVRERFLREGYAANKVGHSGAVKVLDDDMVKSGPDDGTAYLVMELLQGESLQDRIANERPVSEREFLQVASAVLRVLEKAHANGVLHRDLKPENIFILRDEPDPDAEPGDESQPQLDAPKDSIPIGRPRVKVLDFGLARVLDAHSSTSVGLALGTPSFMSPEQASGENKDLDGRTDLFSLGATGFTVVGGRRVHEGAPHPVMQVANMASLPAPKLKSVAPHVSLPFARVIDHALAFKREDRYADATEMRADVEKAILEIDQLGRNPTVHEFNVVPGADAVTVRPPPAPTSKPEVGAADDARAEPVRLSVGDAYATGTLATTKIGAVTKEGSDPETVDPGSASGPRSAADGQPGSEEAAASAGSAGETPDAKKPFNLGIAALVVIGMFGFAVALVVGLRSQAPDGASSDAAQAIEAELADVTGAPDAMSPLLGADVDASTDASADEAGAEVMLELEAGPTASTYRPLPRPRPSGTPRPPVKPPVKPPTKPPVKPPPKK